MSNNNDKRKEKPKKSGNSQKQSSSPNRSVNVSMKSALNNSRFMQYSPGELNQADMALKNSRKKTYPSRSPERTIYDLINNRTSETGYDSRPIRHPSPTRLQESYSSKNRVMTLENREVDTPKFNGKKTFFGVQTNYDPVMGLYRSNSSFYSTAEKRRRGSTSPSEDQNIAREGGIPNTNALYKSVNSNNNNNLNKNLFGSTGGDFRRIHHNDFEKPVRRSSELDRSFDSAAGRTSNNAHRGSDAGYKNSSLNRSKMLLGLLPNNNENRGYFSTK